MSIDWSRLGTLKNKQEIEAELRRLIGSDNYGRDVGQWCITELINERSNASREALRIIQGVDAWGKSEDGPGPVRGADGLDLRIKLRVLSRQACTEAADGKGIDYWDSTETDNVSGNGEFCPTADELPKKGDIVWVKGAAIKADPVTKERLIKKHKLAMVARMEAKLGRQIKPHLALYHFSKYAVDADGCITASFLHAVQLLKTKGLRIAYPQFTSGAAKRMKNTRQITNWLFEEVCSGDKPKRRTRGPNKPKAGIGSASDTEKQEATNDESIN